MADKPTTKKRAKRARKSKPADPTSSAPAAEAREVSSEDGARTAEAPEKPEAPNKLPPTGFIPLQGVQFKSPVKVAGLRTTNGIFGDANTGKLSIFEIRPTPAGPTVFILTKKGAAAKDSPVKVPIENVSYWV